MSALPPPHASALTFQELKNLDLRNALAEVELVFGPSDRWSADEWERRGIDDLDGLLCSSISFCLGPAPRDVLIFTSECIADSTPEESGQLNPKKPGQISQRRRLESQSDTQTKITDNVPPRKKSPTRQREKSPIRQSGKSPADRVPVTLWVCPPEYLKSLLMKLGQQEWITEVRISGLLILLDFIIRKFKSKQSKDGRGRRLRISADLAHGYSSSIKRRKSNTTIQEPLALLEAIGALEKLEDAKFGGPVTCSASYAVPDAFLEAVGQIVVLLTPYVAKKREDAHQRREDRLNRKYRWRQQLCRDLAKVTLDPEGLRIAASFLDDEDKGPSVRVILQILAGRIEAAISPTTYGTIWNSFGQCLRELKPHLLIEGSPVSLCDIANTHFCFFPLLLSEEIKSEEQGAQCSVQKLESLRRELQALREFLGTGDFYSKFSEDPASRAERQKTKETLLKLLNWKNEWARDHHLYERLKSRFPFTLNVVESIKQKGPSRISRYLLHNTACIINVALIRCQERGISAVPDTDSIICPAAHREVVCRIIGEEMHKLTGVCCLVGGRRYDPGEA